MSDGSDPLQRPILDEIVQASPVVLFALRQSEAGLVPVWMCSNVERILEHPTVTADDPAWWFEAVHPEDREQVDEARSRVAREGGQRFEFRLRDGTGSYRWLREQIRPPDASESENVDAVGSWSDVTAVRRLETRLHHAGRMEVLGRFAGGLAHEFNNLLTVIRGTVDLLRSRIGGDPEAAEELDRIEGAADRGRWMVSQLMAHSSRQTDEDRAADLDERVSEAGPSLRELLGEDVRLDFTTEDVPAVPMDPAHIDRIVTNLVANAGDAIQGSGTVRVRTNSLSVGIENHHFPDLVPGSYVVLSVEDTGEGMDEATQRRALDPFFTTRDRDERPGLGLSTVYGLVTRAGGHVELESNPGEGTRVSVYLPVRDGTTDATATDG